MNYRIPPSAAISISLLFATTVSAQQQIVCSGEAAGGYAAFPDVCRLPDGELLCVFYSGYSHVSTPRAQWPKGGRILSVRSRDDGRTWGKPAVIMDTVEDDRDPSVACLHDGTLLLDWFTIHQGRPVVWFARSTDQGRTWGRPAMLDVKSPYGFACSSPVRELPDGSLILGLYHEDPKKNLAFGATVKSCDGGKTWRDLATIGERAGVYLDAETDVVPLPGGKFLAALRSSKTDMHFADSSDGGKSWGPVRSSGFHGESPYFLRHSSGTVLLAHRARPRRCTGRRTTAGRGKAPCGSTPSTARIRAWWNYPTARCIAFTTRREKVRASVACGCGWTRRA